MISAVGVSARLVSTAVEMGDPESELKIGLDLIGPVAYKAVVV
jgi:hypothetical protein